MTTPPEITPEEAKRSITLKIRGRWVTLVGIDAFVDFPYVYEQIKAEEEGYCD